MWVPPSPSRPPSLRLESTIPAMTTLLTTGLDRAALGSPTAVMESGNPYGGLVCVPQVRRPTKALGACRVAGVPGWPERPLRGPLAWPASSNGRVWRVAESRVNVDRPVSGGRLFDGSGRPGPRGAPRASGGDRGSGAREGAMVLAVDSNADGLAEAEARPSGRLPPRVAFRRRHRDAQVQDAVAAAVRQVSAGSTCVPVAGAARFGASWNGTCRLVGHRLPGAEGTYWAPARRAGDVGRGGPGPARS